MKEIKQLKPPQKPNGCLPASIGWKNTHTKITKKSPQTTVCNKGVDDYSALMHRAKITVPTTNRWKAKLTTTNSKLTPH